LSGGIAAVQRERGGLDRKAPDTNARGGEPWRKKKYVPVQKFRSKERGKCPRGGQLPLTRDMDEPTQRGPLTKPKKSNFGNEPTREESANGSIQSQKA